ncbi:MAG: isoleucine--tRNA ligase [Candidatus Omnitrophota bacterium]|nr:MAG: isoleucine--tRNA ligase [Candidatus Omnitrophota bacterium]
MDYKKTLNLPHTEFKMKADLPQKEPQIEKAWKEIGIYSKIRSKRKGKKKYILHDGPPYANGDIHIGHVLNKTIKDIIIKYKTMQGFDSAYVPGWDCHGLPVEHQLFKELNISKHDISQIEFRKKAHKHAMGFVKTQKEQFKRLGVFGDWDRAYLTLSPQYEEAAIRSFAKLVRDDYIYKGLKPVNWCYNCETALAEAEVEYEDRSSPSIYVKFKVKGLPKTLTTDYGLRTTDHIVIWTTTPWTLIANVAVSVHPDFEYAFIEANGDILIMAKELINSVMQKLGIKDYKIKSTYKGSGLEGVRYEHPFGLREGRVVLADYVSLEEGTGCVHTAPGHGEEDYITGTKYGLDTIMPVDEKGDFTDEAGRFKNMNVHKADSKIIEELKKLNLLLNNSEITHSYPHCWRCKNPIIFRATEQWFMSVDKHNLRQRLLDAIDKDIGWIPPQGKERIFTMVGNRPDWCLSRQRYWGVPIPVFKCKSCNKWIRDAKLIDYFADMASKQGTDVWFEKNAKDLIPKDYKCPECEGCNFQKGSDIIDVWFESGVSHQAVLKPNDELDYPCEIYVEGSDQHRGWFQTSLITAQALDNQSPFKSVLTHGFVVDGEGKKMSKSLGNVVSPQEVIKDYGADILRLWVASSNYSEDVRISNEILARLTESYRKIRNTARYMLGNLFDFSPDKDNVIYKDLLPIDKWAVSKAHQLLKESTEYYEKFLFHKVYRIVYNFCVVSMSNFYLDILKDRLYTFGKNSLVRKSAQTAIYEILTILNTIIAPVLAFTAEEIYKYIPKLKNAPESIHLCLWPEIDESKIDYELQQEWQRLIDIRETVLKVLEDKRINNTIGNSLEAAVSLYTESERDYKFLQGHKEELPSIFIVSQVDLHKCIPPEEAVVCLPAGKACEDSKIFVLAKRAKGSKCSRCWNYSTTVGQDKKHPLICKRCVEVIGGE